MANVFDYLAWRGDLSFAAAPFCEVDNLILAMLSFMDYDGIVGNEPTATPIKMTDCLARYREKYPAGEDLGTIIPGETVQLFEKAAESERYADLYLTFYRNTLDEDTVTQFAAVTFILPDHSLFVAFRGTDDNLVGWREDFNLSFTHPIPAQSMALSYLTEIAAVYRGNIRLGGHSKGGNLSIYAAVFASPEIRQRVVVAYSNDGPGFLPEVLENPAFEEMSDRLCTFVPQSSVIGMLLEHNEDYQVIESTVSTGLFQHNPFTWTVLGSRFVHLDSLSHVGRRHDEVLQNWLKNVTPEERRHFTEVLFGILTSTGAKTVSDLSVDQFTKLSAATRAFNELDKPTKDRLYQFLKRLAEAEFHFRMGR